MASAETPAETEAVPIVETTATDTTPATKDTTSTTEDVTMEAATVDPKDFDKKALKQIEFYFSDANLPFDKFMWQLHTKEAAHWVPLKTIASFKRMSEYTTKLGVPHLAQLVRESKSGLLEMDEEGVNVRRKKELLPPGSEQFERSVYAKGFGDEVPGLQKKLEVFFEQYGPVNVVRLRRKDKKKDGNTDFKGSAFCEYKTQEGSQAFLSADPKPIWEGEELLTMSKNEYVHMKAKEKGFAVPNPSTILVGNKSRSFNAFKLMAEEKKGKGKSKATGKDKDKEDAEGSDEEDAEEAPEAKHIFMDGKKYKIGSEGTVNPDDLTVPKGKVLKWSGAGEGVEPYNAIKGALKSHFEKLPYIKGGDDGSGYAAFITILTDEQLQLVKEKVPEIHGKEVTWERLTDEEEKSYWSDRANDLAKQVLDGKLDTNPRSNQRGGRGGRGARGGRGGRGRGRGRGGGGGGGRGDQKRKREDADTKESKSASDSPAKGSVPTIAVAAKKARVEGDD